MTREEAIKKFEKQLHSAMVVLDSGFGTRPGESDRLYRERKELAEIALSALRQQESKPQWISVKDRMPESGVHVLLCCEIHRYNGGVFGKYICDGFYAEHHKHTAGGFPDDCACEYSEEHDEYFLIEGWYEVIKNWDDYNSVSIGDFVTHWMPLPEPPKGE